jgi:hypothetical protein
LPDHIVVGDLVLFLTGGAKCDHAIGTVLRVTYPEHEGIKEAFRVVRAEW